MILSVCGDVRTDGVVGHKIIFDSSKKMQIEYLGKRVCLTGQVVAGTVVIIKSQSGSGLSDCIDVYQTDEQGNIKQFSIESFFEMHLKKLADARKAVRDLLQDKHLTDLLNTRDSMFRHFANGIKEKADAVWSAICAFDRNW